eukprot:3816062-Amphidinium_carterae.1
MRPAKGPKGSTNRGKKHERAKLLASTRPSRLFQCKVKTVLKARERRQSNKSTTENYRENVVNPSFQETEGVGMKQPWAK